MSDADAAQKFFGGLLHFDAAELAQVCSEMKENDHWHLDCGDGCPHHSALAQVKAAFVLSDIEPGGSGGP